MKFVHEKRSFLSLMNTEHGRLEITWNWFQWCHCWFRSYQDTQGLYERKEETFKALSVSENSESRSCMTSRGTVAGCCRDNLPRPERHGRRRWYAMLVRSLTARMTMIGDSGGWRRPHVGCGQRDNVKRESASLYSMRFGDHSQSLHCTRTLTLVA